MESCPTCRPLGSHERHVLAAVALSPLVLAAGVAALVVVPSEPPLLLQLLALVAALLAAVSAVVVASALVGAAVAARRHQHDNACRARTVLTAASLPLVLLRDGGH